MRYVKTLVDKKIERLERKIEEMEARLNNVDERVRLLGDINRLELEKENEEIQRRLRNHAPTFFDPYYF